MDSENNTDNYRDRFQHFVWRNVVGYQDNQYIEPAREAVYSPVPKRYAGSVIGNVLEARGVYSHQALAADILDQNQNVVMTTGTGSGKSRAYMAEAFHIIMNDPEARVLPFYPLKALGHDQHGKWVAMASELGLSPDIITTIDGNVRDMDERMARLKRGRIVLMTPDIGHSWMMRNIANPIVQDFICNRRLTILDEIDTYHGLFGTNMLLFLRRLEDHQARLDRAHLRNEDHRYIATSATLPDAAAFFEELTGYPAIEIGDDKNGAPQKERTIVHHAIHWESRYRAVQQMVESFIESDFPGQGIVFFDSRRNVEEMAAKINERFMRSIGREIAIPQKAGYSPEEQERLEKRLLNGDAKVVIATSAWESGIDFDFSFGINVGEPLSKKSARQRIGRIGRRQEGVFAFIAPQEGFRINRDIRNLSEYMEKVALEMPKLYPQNEFIQISQAFCYQDECTKLEESGVKLFKPMQKTSWPRGFIGACDKVANPYKNITDEKKILIPPKPYKYKPQYFHSLRNMSGSSFLLAASSGHAPPRMVGSCGLMNALEEYPPGAIVRHAGERRRVTRWETVNGQDRIVMMPYDGPNKTKHQLKTEIFIKLDSKSVVEGNYYEFSGQDFKGLKTETPDMESEEEGSSSSKPFMALVRGKVARIVSSFIEITPKGDVYPYRYYDDHELQDLKDKLGENTFDYGPKRRVRMSTTGFLLHIPANWFGKTSREALAEIITDTYAAAANINRTDIGYATQDIMVSKGDGEKIKNYMMYIYDKTPGSIGLSHGLIIDKMHSLLNLLRPIALTYDRESEKRPIYRIRQLGGVMRKMAQVELKEMLDKNRAYPKLPRQHYFMIGPGSTALLEETNGSSTRVKIIKPVMAGREPGYLIEKVKRSAFYKGRKFVFAEVTHDGLRIAGKEAKNEDQPSNHKHFVAANLLTLERGKRVAMDIKTGALSEVFELAAANGSKEFGWQPMKLSPELESLKLDIAV